MSEEVALENETKRQPKTEKLIFRWLPVYAKFVRENYLIPYIQEQIRISRSINLPMLRFFSGMTDDELIAMSIISHTEFLTCMEENGLQAQLERSLDLWVKDQLKIIKREEITAEDITLTGYVRKKALLKFLPSFTTDVSEAIEIIKEIDTYTVEADTAATNIYIKLLKNHINEQAHFTDIISHTTPGLNYVFSLTNGQIKYANEKYQQFFGYDTRELAEMGNSFITNVVHPDDITENSKAQERCTKAADGEVISWEYRLKKSDGKYYWMRNYSSVFKRNLQGTPIEIVGIILDIDSEKEIADKLILRERQLLDAQAQAQLGSFELDVETGKMDVTPQFKQIYEVGDFDLSTLIDNVHPADRDRVNANRDRAIAEDGLYDNEYRYVVNGKEKVLWSRGVIAYKNGRKVMMGTVMDVTNRRKMIRDLLESRDLYKQAQELSHIGNWTWDLVTGDIEWSDELYRIYGMPVGTELRFEDILAFNRPEDNVVVKQKLKISKETLQPSDTYYHITLNDGTQKVLHAKTETTGDSSGKAVRMVGIIQDVTEKQLLIEQLQQSEYLYKQAQAISHIGNWSWDMETKKLDWSDEVYRIYGLEPGSLDNSFSLEQYNQPEDQSLVSNAIAHTIETKEPFDFNYRIVLRDGTTKTLHARGELEQTGENPTRIFGTLQISHSKKL